MQTPTASESRIHLNEPVESLLRLKGHAVWSISPEATVYEAIEHMSEKQIGALVVLIGGKLAGIVSERDYARRVILKGKHSRETRVREIMSSPVLYVKPQQSADECMRLDDLAPRAPPAGAPRGECRGGGLHRRSAELGHHFARADHPPFAELHPGRLPYLTRRFAAR